MDLGHGDGDGVPPPIRRASRDSLALHKTLDHLHLDSHSFDDDEAEPPPIRRHRTSSSGPSPSKRPFKFAVASPTRSKPGPAQAAIPPAVATPPARTLVLPYPQHDPPSPSSLARNIPAPMPSQRPELRVNTSPAPAPDTQTPPLPPKSPLRSRLEPQHPKSDGPKHARNFSHPFKDRAQFPTQSQPKYANTSSYRNPPRPLSYRNSPRMPYSLRRWSSLETIASVQTIQELERENSLEEENSLEDSESIHSTHTSSTANTPGSKRQYLSFYDGDDDDADDVESEAEDGIETLVATNVSSTPPDSSVAVSLSPSDLSRSQSSASSSRHSASTTTQGSGSKKSTATSIIQRLKRNKEPEPLLLPDHLEIHKRVSIDQRSRTNSATSSMTISSGRPSDIGVTGFSQGSQSQLSVSSKDWKASDFDTSGLSEAELKKCKKKGINPSLYAEMKAARKGRLVSPIGGNTFI